MMKYDLVVKGIRIFQAGEWKAWDLAIREKMISRLSPSGAEKLDAGQTLDFSGSFASAGWVDLHTHLLPLRSAGIGTRAKRIGLNSGVTALLDVGTTGAKNFPLLYEKVIRKSATPVLAFLNIKGSGIRFWQIGVGREKEDDLEAMERTLKNYPGYIKGIKITASREHMLAEDPLYYMRKAREAGDRLGLPIMVHIGWSPPSLIDLLPLMKAGDILTHCFRNSDHTILDPSGKIREDILLAKSRGVRFDIGHGIRSFSFPVAQKALDQGFDDFTISSDLYLLSTPFRAKNFANVLTKFLALGMKLEEVMFRASSKPAAILGLEREIAPGKPASITIFRLDQGRFRLKDCWGQSRTGNQRIIPQAALLEGKFFPAA